MKDYFLEVKNLRLFYQAGKNIVRAVDGVSLEIERAGQALAVVGESGCGKSSLGSALLRLLPHNTAEFSGKIRLAGQEILALPEDAFRRQFRWKKIAWVPQNTKGSLNPIYKIEAQFEETFKAHNVEIDKEEIPRLLRIVGLSSDKGGAIPDRLSGGEIQRVCIAMAIALKPALIILDEPTSALDSSLQGQIISLLDELKKKFSCSYIFITHDIEQAKSICEFFAVLYAGQIIERGTKEQVLDFPLHPYTRKLLDCKGIKYIPGEPPDLRELPKGCRFQPRCDKAGPGCRDEAPPLEDKGGGHFVACYKA